MRETARFSVQCLLFVGLTGWTLTQGACTLEPPHTATPHTQRKTGVIIQKHTDYPLKRPSIRKKHRTQNHTHRSRIHLAYRVHRIRAKAAHHAGVEALIAPYRKRLGERMKMVLATTPTALSRGVPESRLGSLVAEACLGRMRALGWQVDLFITNLGGIRKDLGAGDIQVRDVFELLPFENILVRVSLRGDELRALMGLLAQQGGEPLAGARVLLYRDHRVKQAWIGGKELDDKATYILGTSDYLAKTGWMSPILRKKRLDSTDLTLRDAMMWALAEQGLRWPHALDGRIRIENRVNSAPIRIENHATSAPTRIKSHATSAPSMPSKRR